MSVQRNIFRDPLRSGVRSADPVPAPLLFMPLRTDLSINIGTGSATFTGSTIRTFIDQSDGVLKTAAIDAARFERQGILVEGASTNLLLRSEEFDNGAWAKTGGTLIDANITTSPDGNLTADKLKDDSSTGTAELSVQRGLTVTSGKDTTVSIFASKDQLDLIAIQTFLFDASGNGVTWFNLTTGTAGTTSVNHTVKIKPLANGFFRCSITFKSTTDLAGFIRYTVAQTDGSLTVDKDGTSSIFIFGAQGEELPFASSYIKTVASTVTRTADNLSIPAGNIPAPTSDYSVSFNFDILGFVTSGFPRLYAVVGETSRFSFGNNSNSLLSFRHGAVDSVSTTVISAGVSTKFTGTVGASNQTIFINGVQEDQDVKGTVTGTATSIAIGDQGAGSSTQIIWGHIKNFRIDPVALTAAQVGALP